MGEDMKPVVFSRHECFVPETFGEYEKPTAIHCDVANFEDRTPYRVYVQLETLESKSVTEVIANYKFYDRILAWHESLLACPNATKLVGQCGPCAGVFAPDTLSYREDLAKPWSTAPLVAKRFGASLLVSEKQWYPGHKYRHEVYHKLPAVVGRVPITKHLAPPRMAPQPSAEFIAGFQYHIIVEPVFYRDFFTEKLTNSFLTHTVPIYCGCPSIGEYFNMDGVLRFSNTEELVRHLRGIVPETYERMLPAIEDNYERALAYKNVCSRIDKTIAEG